MEIFDEVYWRVVGTVDAPREALVALLPEMRAGHRAGDPRRMQEVLRRHLPDGTWRWPAYEAYVGPRNERDRRAEVCELRRYDLSDFLTSMSVSGLRELYKAYSSPDVKSPGRGKAEIIPALLALLSPEQQTGLLKRLRDEAIAEYDQPAPLDYREMGVLLCRRIATILYAEERYAQLADPDLLSLRPRWRFHWGADGAKACRQFNGKTLPKGEAEKSFPSIPCECLECSCYLSAEK